MSHEDSAVDALPCVKPAANGALLISGGGVHLLLAPAPGANLEPIGEEKLELLLHSTRKLSGRFAEMIQPFRSLPGFLDPAYPGFYASPEMSDDGPQCVLYLTTAIHAGIVAGALDDELATTVGTFRPRVLREVVTFERRASMTLGREVKVNMAGVRGVDASETGGHSVG